MLSSLIEDEKERRGGVGVERQAAAPPHAALSVVSFPSSSSLHWIRVASKSTVTYKASEKKRKRQQSKKAGGRTGAIAMERQAGRLAGRQAGIHSRRQRRCCCYSLARRCLPFYRICIWLSDWGDQGGRVKCFGSPSPHIVSQRARLVVWKRRACHWTMQWNIYNHDILSYYLNSKFKNFFECHEVIFWYHRWNCSNL